MAFAHTDLLFIISNYGYVAIAALLAGGIFGLPIPDETIMIFSGYLVFTGVLKYIPTIIAAWVGSIMGMTLSYLLGYYVGLPAFNRFGHRFGLTVERLGNVQRLFNKFGKFTIPIGYFIPGVRQLTAFFSAVSKMPYREFAGYAYPGGLLWAMVFVTLGVYLGKGWDKMTKYFNPYHYIVLGILIFVITIYLVNKVGRKFLADKNSKPDSASIKKDKTL